MNRSRTAVSLVVAASLLAACGSVDDLSTDDAAVTSSVGSVPAATDAPADSLVIQDDLGDVDVVAPAITIVTTSDEATEMVVALGVQPVGVASSRVDAAPSDGERFDDYFLPTDQLGTPEFVGGEALNFEAIAALEPDLIVHASADDNVETPREIAPTVVYDVQIPGRWQGALASLGEATGRVDEAAALIDGYDDALAAARTELEAVAEVNPNLTVIYPNYRGGEENFVFDADFALASVVPELGFELVGIDAAEPAFPGVGMISTESYEDLAAGTDTIIAINPDDWAETESGPFLETLSVPVIGVQVDEGRPSTGPLSAPVYLQRFVDALTAQYGESADASTTEGPETGTGTVSD